MARKRKEETEEQPTPEHYLAHIFLQESQIIDILLKDLNARGYIVEGIELIYDAESDSCYAQCDAALPINITPPPVEQKQD